jgi:hypothetical protein
MEALMATVLLLACGAVALAKPIPVEQPNEALVRANINISNVRTMRDNIELVGAMREREYFEAPQPLLRPGTVPCRLESILFDGTRLVQSCREIK